MDREKDVFGGEWIDNLQDPDNDESDWRSNATGRNVDVVTWIVRTGMYRWDSSY